MTPMKTMRETQEEWLEYKEAKVKASRMSTEETARQAILHQRQEDTKGIMRMRFVTKKLKYTNRNWGHDLS